eukprot:6943957-Pyramimonas_sp.AAC.2
MQDGCVWGQGAPTGEEEDLLGVDGLDGLGHEALLVLALVRLVEHHVPPVDGGVQRVLHVLADHHL